MKIKKIFKKSFVYLTLTSGSFLLQTTPVFAAQGPDRTIRGLNDLQNLINSGQGTEFKDTFTSLLAILRNTCIITVAVAFACVFASVIIQAGKLGGANVLAPEGNTKSRQQAYDGLMHAIINFGIIGAAGTIFSALCKFLLGI